MPPSSQADRLVKALHPFLSSKVPMGELRSLGWLDFLNNDRPETSDAVEMGTEAFLYLSIEDDGSWNRQTGVLTSVLAFLHNRTGKNPTAVDLSDLKAILEQAPQAKVIRDWFERVYR